MQPFSRAATFKVLLSRDRVANVLETLEVYKPVNAVFARESRVNVVLVLPDSAPDVILDPHIENTRFTCGDANVVAPHRKAGPSLRSG